MSRPAWRPARAWSPNICEKAGLLEPLAELGFNVVGYGCTTCIGNSGPLPGEVVKAITSGDLVAAAVLSGNRNFEGRVHPYVRANYLASPPLVVAYALAGTVDIDLLHEPLGHRPAGPAGLPARHLAHQRRKSSRRSPQAVQPEMFTQKYADVFTGNETWNAIQSGEQRAVCLGSGIDLHPGAALLYRPDPRRAATSRISARRASWLCWAIRSPPTTSLRPARSPPTARPGRYLVEHGVAPRDFNSYGSRRGNDRVMTRGTFANIRLKNRLLPGVEGGVTLHLPDGEQMSIYDAAMKYQEEGVPLVVLAGKEYGTGSSRDWAAKGTLLLGVRAVHGRILRAHPPLQPGRHGRAAAGVQAGRERGYAGADRPRDLHHRRPER